MAEDTNATPTQRDISRLNGAIDKIVVSGHHIHRTDRTVERCAGRPPCGCRRVPGRPQEQDGGNILIFGSRTLWNALLTDGLVDELHLMIGPVALGAGTALFIGQPEVSLGLIDGPPMWNG